MAGANSLRWRVAQYLELRWWRRYLSKQSPQDYLSAKRTYWQRVLDTLEWEVKPNARVLDAGCGPAGIFTLLHDRQRITAVDPLLREYETLPVFARVHYPQVRFVPKPLESLEGLYPFDCIYCFNAINHVDDWHRSLDQLTAMARPGTRMILSSDVHRHVWLLPLFRALPGDALHPQQHDAAAYRGALSKRGWTIEREACLRRTAIFDYRAWVCVFDSLACREE
ncbi:class I SAM-dependent methyltransferase [Neolewinella litorea]|uniref:Methyltransferase domain-containing protein n=1 Tax=Neolewinella litorea TaxID=2562452 RepID=A0A4S4NQV0_9BACT|nr:methyltransferase domain-containing protein [Neolewinella litorea]THH41545.1 methyltransferase domain-containing protein [Neolewinella litorea]